MAEFNQSLVEPFIIKKDSPDFNFIILENNNPNTNIRHFQYCTGVPPRLKSRGYISTLLEFNSLIERTLRIIAPVEQIGTVNYFHKPGNDMAVYSPSGVWFSPDFPDFLLPKENPSYKSSLQVIPNIITWGGVRTEPGTVDSRPFTGTQEVHPRFREYLAIFKDEDSQYIVGEDTTKFENTGSVVKFVRVDGQVFDNLIQYNIWSKSNYEVEELTEWFQFEFMNKFIGLFRESGIVNLWFDRRVRDNSLVSMSNGYHVRSVLYYVRTERLTLNSYGPIKRINLRVHVDDLKYAISMLNSHSQNDPQEQLLIKWIDRYKFGG